LVRFIYKLIFNYIYIVIGLAANKCDLIDNEQVSEEKAREFAKEIGAIFKLTSASTSIGIEELFVGVGCKFLDPNYKEDGNKKPEAKIIEEPKVEANPEPKPVQNNNDVIHEPKKENKMHDNIKLNQNAVVKKKKKKFC